MSRSSNLPAVAPSTPCLIGQLCLWAEGYSVELEWREPEIFPSSTDSRLAAGAGQNGLSGATTGIPVAGPAGNPCPPNPPG